MVSSALRLRHGDLCRLAAAAAAAFALYSVSLSVFQVARERMFVGGGEPEPARDRMDTLRLKNICEKLL